MGKRDGRVRRASITLKFVGVYRLQRKNLSVSIFKCQKLKLKTPTYGFNYFNIGNKP